jgi:hypothetical protein
MASEKKPSIYSDRGTIGSTDELDEYGVWVKSEPQDLSSAGLETQESAESSAQGIEDFPDFNADFGGDGDDFGIPGEDSAGKTEEAGFGDSLDFDDLSIPEETSGQPAAEAGFTEVSMEDFLDAGPETLDEPAGLDLDEGGGFDAPEASAAPKAGAADLSTQLLMKIADELSSIRSELSVLKKDFSSIRGKDPAGEAKGEGQKKGFFDEAEDEKIALTGDELDNILNTADFTEEAGSDATEELPGAYPESPSGSFDVVENGDLPDLLSDQDDILAGEAPEEAASEEAAPEEAASEEAASEEAAPEEAAPEEAAPPELLEYEDEEPVEEDDIVIDLDFDDIDPDALPEGSPLGLDASAPGALPQELADFDISLDSAAADEEAGGGFNMPSAASEDAGEGLVEDEDSGELQRLMEEGAQPMTAAPEDTSYLDAEPAEEELSLDDFSLDESSLDLSNAVIDEPDLSNQITENPVQEPSLDDLSLNGGISIDMDMEEEAEEAADGLEAGEAVELSIPEETLDLGLAEPLDLPEETASGGESFAQVIPDGFVVESEGESQGSPEDGFGEDILSGGDIDALEKDSEALDLESPAAEPAPAAEGLDIPTGIKQELRTVLSYMDQLLESLPEEKIEEFAKSEYFDTYKKLFKELGLD